MVMLASGAIGRYERRTRCVPAVYLDGLWKPSRPAIVCNEDMPAEMRWAREQKKGVRQVSKHRKCPIVELAGRKFRLRKRMSNLAAVVALESDPTSLPALRIKATEIGAYELWIVDPLD